MERAWVEVRRNGGASGIDRTTIVDVEEYGVTRLARFSAPIQESFRR